MTTLGRFFPETVTWKAPSTKAAWDRAPRRCAESAKARPRSSRTGAGSPGDYQQDQFLADGTFVSTWQLHWVSGWAPQHGEYRASMVDNYGNAEVYRGQIQGERLVFESMAETGTRLRFTWEASDRDQVAQRAGRRRWLWFLIEEYPMVPG